MSNYLNNPNVARGIRNNNPGNLVITNITWLGKIPVSQNKDGHFEQFTEMKYGIRAMMRDLISDIQKGKTTVTQLISEYAPSFENNTNAYVASVINSIGSNIIDLSQETIVLLCKAIVHVENGNDAKYVTEQDYQAALAILGIPLKKKR